MCWSRACSNEDWILSLNSRVFNALWLAPPHPSVTSPLFPSLAQYSSQRGVSFIRWSAIYVTVIPRRKQKFDFLFIHEFLMSNGQACQSFLVGKAFYSGRAPSILGLRWMFNYEDVIHSIRTERLTGGWHLVDDFLILFTLVRIFLITIFEKGVGALFSKSI